MENIKLPEVDMRILVGKEITAGDRNIWPVMRISILKTCEDSVQAIQITPVAMLIIEPKGPYALSFEGEPMTIEAILEMAPSLRDVLGKKSEGSRRIKVE